MGHATFTYEFYENEGSKTGLSNAANAVHSVDAYILRCMHRRCNYNLESTTIAQVLIEAELEARSHYQDTPEVEDENSKLGYYIKQFNRSGMADIVILPYINAKNVAKLSNIHLQKLQKIAESMLKHHPFELVTIHDAFLSHCNNVNYVRQAYINILADIAESNLLDDLLSQLHGKAGHFNKLSNNLGSLIRNSNYALS